MKLDMETDLVGKKKKKTCYFLVTLGSDFSPGQKTTQKRENPSVNLSYQRFSPTTPTLSPSPLSSKYYFYC